MTNLCVFNIHVGAVVIVVFSNANIIRNPSKSISKKDFYCECVCVCGGVCICIETKAKMETTTSVTEGKEQKKKR